MLRSSRLGRFGGSSFDKDLFQDDGWERLAAAVPAPVVVGVDVPGDLAPGLVLGGKVPSGEQLVLEWRYSGFVSDRTGDVTALQDHRDHAVIDLAIRDLKDGAGWNHCPSGRFNANAASLATGALAHNLWRWTARLGGHENGLVVAKTLRRQLLVLPGRITTSARQFTLHLHARWP